MKYNDIDTGISQAEIDMDKACPECGEMGVTGNGVCLSCLVKIVRNEPMKSVGGMQAQIKILETQEKTKGKIMVAIRSKREPDAEIGHNSGGVSGERLRSLIQRIEKLEEDRAAVCEDIKEVYAEAKGTGFDVKTIRRLVRERKIEIEKRREQYELFDLYAGAIGMEV